LLHRCCVFRSFWHSESMPERPTPTTRGANSRDCCVRHRGHDTRRDTCSLRSSACQHGHRFRQQSVSIGASTTPSAPCSSMFFAMAGAGSSCHLSRLSPAPGAPHDREARRCSTHEPGFDLPGSAEERAEERYSGHNTFPSFLTCRCDRQFTRLRFEG